uniref:Protein kinase domain-containing protein n=1 Tax=Thermosporothrix sp. COM3 TaxID=2490863 RepID=A0A455SAA3_9CHLR|nr:hypothetical protein KTC_01380 [Thermosporothrix sp. COM3]
MTNPTDLSGRIVSDYIIEEKIGQGGFGAVYRARHRHLKRVACVKVVHKNSQAKDLAEFLKREAHVLNELDHRNIVRLQTFTIEEEQIYLVMDYIDGGDLNSLLKKTTGPLPIEEVDDIIGQIATGLHYAHQRQVIHRDLKPHNILRDKQGRIVIGDFGLAKFLDVALHHTFQAAPDDNAGTPLYMAPEHFNGQPDYSSDLYSLGVIAYQLLTRHLPFTGNNWFQLRDAHCNKQPPPLRSFNPALSEEVEQVVLKMLEKEPEKRYQSPIDFKRALHSAIEKMRVNTRVNPDTIAGVLPYLPDNLTVQLDSGDYRGPFTISKRLRLIGAGAATRLYTVDEPLLHIQVPGVRLENMLLQRSRESYDEPLIQAAGHPYELRYVTVLGGAAEGATWLDAEWQLPVNGIDFGPVPAESQQTRTIQIEVKEQCTLSTTVPGLSVFPTRIAPGSHTLSLSFETHGKPPGTILNGAIRLQGETETKTIPISGQIQPPLPTPVPMPLAAEPPTHHMEWLYQLWDEAARDILRLLGSDSEKELVHQWKQNQRTPELRTRIHTLGEKMLVRLVGQKAYKWYVRRTQESKQAEHEAWELTLATDSDDFPEALGKRTLRLFVNVVGTTKHRLQIRKITLPREEEGVQNHASLPALVQLVPSLPDYRGIDTAFLARLRALPIRERPELDVNQLQGWEALLNFQKELIKKRHYSVAYTSHTYRDGSSRVTFFLDAASAVDSSGTSLDPAEFVMRIRNSRKERLKRLDSLPNTPSPRKHYGQDLGTIEQFKADENALVISLDPSLVRRLQKGSYALPPNGYLYFDARGDMQQISRQQEALEDLKQGKTVNPRLADFFFNAREAGDIPAIQRLLPSDLLSGTCNSGQRTAIEMALATPDLLLIQGPPGTGKTTVIAEICYQEALRGGRTLIASQSNLAVDNALGRISHHPSIRALRKGNPDSVEDEGRDFTEEQVITTWLHNTASDCQTKQEKRKQNIALFKRLLSGHKRFTRYYQEEERYQKQYQKWRSQYEKVKQELKATSFLIEEEVEAERNAQTVQQALASLLAGRYVQDLASISRNALPYIARTGSKQHFIQSVNEGMQHLQRLMPMPPVTSLLQSVIQLRQHVFVQRDAWEESRSLLSAIDAIITRWQLTDNQREQVAATIQQFETKIQQLNEQIQKSQQTLQQHRRPLNEMQQALQELHLFSRYSLETAIQTYIANETQPRVPSSGLLNIPSLFPGRLIATMKKYDSKPLFAKWQSAAQTIQRRIQALLRDQQHCKQAYYAQLDYQNHYYRLLATDPEISLALLYSPPIVTTSAPPKSTDLPILVQQLAQTLHVIQETIMNPGLFSGMFKKRHQQKLFDLFRQMRDQLFTLEHGIKLIHTTNYEATQHFCRNIANHIYDTLQGQIQQRITQIRSQLEQANQQKRELEQQVQQLRSEQQTQRELLPVLAQTLQHIHSELAEHLRQLSLRSDISKELLTLARDQLQTRDTTPDFVQRYRSVSQRWLADTRQAEQLVHTLWEQLQKTHDLLPQQLLQLRDDLKQHQKQQEILQRELVRLEQTAGSKPAGLQIERQWWRSFWESIPAEVRPAAPSEGIFALPFLQSMQHQFNSWQQELDNEERFSQRYDRLITDWVAELQNISAYDRQELQQTYIKNANVVGITCGQAPRLSSREFSAISTFDTVIIDEVSKATPPEILLPAIRGKKLILIGDQHQLPPMIDDKTLDQMAEENGLDPQTYHQLNQSYFARLYRDAPASKKCMLHIQYRMHPDIMAAINQFYERPLECGLNQPDLERDHQLEVPLVDKNKHLVWVTTPLTSVQERTGQQLIARNQSSKEVVFTCPSKYHSFSEERVGTSYINQREVEIITAICQQFQQAWAPKLAAGAPPKEIGVITFYAAQSSLLRESLGVSQGGKSARFSALNIRVGTVDRFQGIERAVVIVSMVRNNSRGDIGFARKDERINVAFSRAQELLVIVGCHDLFCSTSHADTAVERYRNVASIVKHRGAFIDTTAI